MTRNASMMLMVVLLLAFGSPDRIVSVQGQSAGKTVSKDPFAADPGLDIDAKELAKVDPKVAKELARIPGKDFQWPGTLPRPGSTKIFENEFLSIFDDDMSTDGTWHRHIREAVAIGIKPGRISELFVDGTINIGEAGMTRGPLPSLSRFRNLGASSTVGHAEWSTDPDRRRRAIYIEFKGTELEGCKAWSPLCQ
jgi:hypothetical protein